MRSVQHQNASSAATDYAKFVKTVARKEGFDLCGVAQAGPADPDRNLAAWLRAGYAADMTWIGRTQSVREDIEQRVPGAKSVVVVARNYYSERPARQPGTGRVARYAWGRDYHRVLHKPLRRLAKYIDSLAPESRSYCSIDTGPVLERTWAKRAGVGAIGKNSLVLNRRLGSWFVLGVIITTVELEPDEPIGDVCGTCTACIDACPTDAIVANGVVDSNRCISYHTIENRNDVPTALHRDIDDWVFGCDVCQEVCPWNRFATTTDETDFLPRTGHANPDLQELSAIPDENFLDEYEGTPIRRAKAPGIRRNARIALANQAVSDSR